MLKTQLTMTYTLKSKLETPSSKLSKTRTPRKTGLAERSTIKEKQAQQHHVSVKENLPDILNDTLLDKKIDEYTKELENVFVQPLGADEIRAARKIISMEETFDMYDTSAMISVDRQEFEMGQFPLDMFQDMLTTTTTTLDQNKENFVISYDSMFQMEYGEKTVERPQIREPFKEIDTNERVRRSSAFGTIDRQSLVSLGDQTGRISTFMEDKQQQQPMDTIIPVEQMDQLRYLFKPDLKFFVCKFKIYFHNLKRPDQIPLLYQESMIEVGGAQQAQQSDTTVPQIVVISADETTTTTEVSMNVDQNNNQIQAETTAITSRRAQKRKGLLIDKNTKLPENEMYKRIHRSRLAAEAARREMADDEIVDTKEIEQRIERSILDNLFSDVIKQNIAVRTRYDFLNENLIRLPTSFHSKRAKCVDLTVNLKTDVRTKLIQPNLRSIKETTHTQLYLLVGSEQQEQDLVELQQQSMQEQMMRQQQESVRPTDVTSEMASGATEKRSTVRKKVEFQGVKPLKEEEDGSVLGKKDKQQLQDQTAVELAPMQLQFEETFVQPEVLPPPAQYDQPIETTVAQEQLQAPPPEEVFVPEGPREDYEAILLNSIKSFEENHREPVLQSIIHENDLTERCLKSTKPRKFYAIKLFQATLSKNPQIKNKQSFTFETFCF
jgi:hypothetical protein